MNNNITIYNQNILEKIPLEIRELLILSNKNPSDAVFGSIFIVEINLTKKSVIETKQLGDDPSTIFTQSLVRKPEKNDYFEKVGYFPNYLELSPEQKYVYLKWLLNIDVPIDIGYVFVFYYGLEKHLLLGQFDKAFAIIKRLREHHSNKSFLEYTKYALFYSSIIKNRIDKLNELQFMLEDNVYYTEHILLKNFFNQPLNSNDVTKIINGIKETNKLYIKKDFKYYAEKMRNILLKEYGSEYLFIVNEKISKTKYIPKACFANFSFPDDIRFLPSPNIIQDDEFRKGIIRLHELCHNSIKKKK